MSLLRTERATLEAFLPSLDKRLNAMAFMDREQADGKAIAAFRDCGGAALLIPTEYGGKGASVLDAVRIHRAIASRSPSLGVAATMHSFSVATMVAFAMFGGEEEAAALLGAIADNNLLLASGFAEGRSGTNILAATMTARTTEDGGYLISGSKKPCSLSKSLDLLTASAVLEQEGKEPHRAIVLVPADAPGITRKPFWNSPVLNGAESNELILKDVPIPGDFLFLAEINDDLDPVELAGYLWFQLLVTASYLGTATALVERAIEGERGSVSDRALLGIEVESAMASLEGVASDLAANGAADPLLARAFSVRFSIQRAIERATMMAADLLGGMAFISAPDVAYLLAASRALAFHPPSRTSMSNALTAYFGGQSLAVL